jgi:hypothetical protein
MLLHALANPDPAALLGVAMTIFNAYPILIKPDDTNFIVSVEFVDRGASAVDWILIDNGTMAGRQKENTGGYLIHVVSPEYDDSSSSPTIMFTKQPWILERGATGL